MSDQEQYYKLIKKFLMDLFQATGDDVSTVEKHADDVILAIYELTLTYLLLEKLPEERAAFKIAVEKVPELQDRLVLVAKFFEKNDTQKAFADAIYDTMNLYFESASGELSEEQKKTTNQTIVRFIRENFQTL